MENTSAIEWIMSKATRTEYAADVEAGYPANSVYDFSGGLPARMIRAIVDYAESIGAARRDRGSEVTYNWAVGENTYSFTRAIYGNGCRFTAQIVG